MRKQRKKCKYCNRTFAEDWALKNHEKNCQEKEGGENKE